MRNRTTLTGGFNHDKSKAEIALNHLTLWIKGFDLDHDRELELINWVTEAHGVISTKEIKSAIQEKIDFGY